jgi:hypothetical protein
MQSQPIVVRVEWAVLGDAHAMVVRHLQQLVSDDRTCFARTRAVAHARELRLTRR